MKNEMVKKPSITLISATKQIYERPFFYPFLHQYRSIKANQGQSRLYLLCSTMHIKSKIGKIGKDNGSLTDGRTYQPTDISYLTVIDLT